MGSFALTLSPKSWYEILFELFGTRTDMDCCSYIDVGCGQGHGVIYAHQLLGVSSWGIDFDEVINVAQLTWEALIRRGDVDKVKTSDLSDSSAHLQYQIGDAHNTDFTLAPYTHASCIIDDADVVVRFIELAQATHKGNKRKRQRVERIVFVVPNRGMPALEDFNFPEYRQFKVSLEGGRCSRSVCSATL
jgi:hypothetical protein